MKTRPTLTFSLPRYPDRSFNTGRLRQPTRRPRTGRRRRRGPQPDRRHTRHPAGSTSAIDPYSLAALKDPKSPLSKRSVYFDFDSYVVKDEFKSLIEAHAQFLAKNPKMKMLIQGNADERGSREYNLALGQKRAEAVKKALLLLGAQEEQVESVSLGEEKPACTEQTEACWAQEPPRRHALFGRVLMKFRAVLLLGLFATLPAHAGLFDDDEARQQVAELRKTVDALSKRIDSATQNQLDFSNQVEALRKAVAHLRGQIEVLTNSLEAAQKRQQDFYVDLDNRLRKLEGTSSPEAGPCRRPGTTARRREQVRPGRRNARLRSRAERLPRRQVQGSRRRPSQTFITRYPKSAPAPRRTTGPAQPLPAQGRTPAPPTAFGTVATTWPNDAKAPDALLSQANALVSATAMPRAREERSKLLVEKYPTSPAARPRAPPKTLALKKK